MRSFFEDKSNREFLRLEYERAKAIAWTTVKYFYCRPLRLFLEVGKEVRGGIIDESALCPEFELGSVQEALPASPISFLWKYLKDDYEQPSDDLPVSPEALSLWLLSWIASSGPTEGASNAS